MCLKKPCGELCAGLHLSDAFAVYKCLKQEVFILFLNGHRLSVKVSAH